MTRIATCRSCGDVLVMTFAWRGYEFVCLGCGRLETYVGPVGVDETLEMLQRKAEWLEMSAGLLPGGAMLRACADAGGHCRYEAHVLHATPEELEAHTAAQARIGERLRRRPT